MIELLELALESDKFLFLPHLGVIAQMLARAGADSNPEMKQKVASFAGLLCRELKQNKVGQYMKTTVISLTVNLAHQHSKVRKVTLRGLQDVVIANGAEAFL